MATIAIYMNKTIGIEDLTIEELHYIKLALMQRKRHFSFNISMEERSFADRMIDQIHDKQNTYAYLEHKMV